MYARYLGADHGVSFLIAEPTCLFDETTAFNPNTPFLMMEYMRDLYGRLLEGKTLEQLGQELMDLVENN